MENKELRSYGRMGMISHLFKIAAENYFESLGIVKEIDKLKNAGGSVNEQNYDGPKEFIYKEQERIDFLEFKQERKFITIVVFLAIYLESYIYDFGASVLGDTYVKNYLDKLDVISKWVMIPRLITGEEIDRSNKSFADFKELISKRNSFVHHKTKDAFSIIEAHLSGKAQAPEEHDTLEPLRYFEAVNYLLKELRRIDSPNPHGISIREDLYEILLND